MEKEAIEQSEKAYIEQFDPTSPNYHQGSSVPVPLGGKRVPESMPQQHPENFNPAETGPTSEDLGPEYQRIERQRATMTNLKKQLDKLSPFVQAIFRHNENFNTKADKNNQKHAQLHKLDIAKEEKQIESLQVEILGTIKKLTDSSKEFDQIEKQVSSILKQSHTHFQTKQELTEFGFKIKRLTAKIFGDTKKQMQALKKIKKNYKAPPKTEQNPKGPEQIKGQGNQQKPE